MSKRCKPSTIITLRPVGTSSFRTRTCFVMEPSTGKLMKTLIITKRGRMKQPKPCIEAFYSNGEIEPERTQSHHNLTAWPSLGTFSALTNSKGAEISRPQSSQFAIGCAHYSLTDATKRLSWSSLFAVEKKQKEEAQSHVPQRETDSVKTWKCRWSDSWLSVTFSSIEL